MILIGMFDSPFVRRVAVSMKLPGMKFEHRNWSVGKASVAVKDWPEIPFLRKFWAILLSALTQDSRTLCLLASTAQAPRDGDVQVVAPALVKGLPAVFMARECHTIPG